jgi:hypothetical protein
MYKYIPPIKPVPVMVSVTPNNPFSKGMDRALAITPEKHKHSKLKKPFIFFPP